MPPVVGYNRFPDEKGTERSVRRKPKSPTPRYNRFPDEKGTERHQQVLITVKYRVTTVSPMKRGLKGSNPFRTVSIRSVTTVSPMKRGLKARCAERKPRQCMRLQPFPR